MKTHRASQEHDSAALQVMLEKMQQASNSFYSAAISVGNHPFIEFTGLMNEYIKLCQCALESGIDFTKTSIHGNGLALPAEPFHAEYIAEKLGCIYGTTLQSPQLKKAFMEGMFGETK